MGPCFHQSYEHVSKRQDYKRDIINADQTIEPLFSTLYNLLRKNKDLQIINPSMTKLFKNETNPDISNLNINDLKMLYNFKTVIWLGDKSEHLETIVSKTNVKQIFVLSQKYTDSFLKEFPLFSHDDPQKYRPAEIPLLIFNSEQLYVKQMKHANKIFLHIKDYSNQSLYKKLGANRIIIENSPQYKEKLTKSHDSLIYMHSKETSQNQLVQLFTVVLMKRYHTDEITTKIYLRRSLPNATLLDPSHHLDNNVGLSVTPKSVRKIEQMSTYEKQQRYFLELKKEIGLSNNLEKIERAYNLLGTLLANIYNNKESDNYRKVKKTNRQVNESLGKYKAGVSLLKLNGFEDEEGYYVNKFESNYLKLLRTDLDLGYKHFLEKAKGQ